METIQTINGHNTKFVVPGTDVGTRLNFKFIAACRFGFIVASPDVLYFFKYVPNKKDDENPKDQYYCILKWRPQELKGTYVTSLSVQEGDEDSPPSECNLAIATKNKQILYLNLYKQVYYPDCSLILQEYQNEAKKQDGASDSDVEIDLSAIKSVGIDEESRHD
jgi:hypothetical protein